jgi:hypothetical protein
MTTRQQVQTFFNQMDDDIRQMKEEDKQRKEAEKDGPLLEPYRHFFRDIGMEPLFNNITIHLNPQSYPNISKTKFNMYKGMELIWAT